jgi:hypothetical protein
VGRESRADVVKSSMVPGTDPTGVRLCPGCFTRLSFAADLCPVCGERVDDPPPHGLRRNTRSDPALAATANDESVDDAPRAKPVRPWRPMVAAAAAIAGILALVTWSLTHVEADRQARPMVEATTRPTTGSSTADAGGAAPGGATTAPSRAAATRVRGRLLPETTGTTLFLAVGGDGPITLNLDTGTVAPLRWAESSSVFSPATVIPVAEGLVEFAGATIRFAPIDGADPVTLAPNRCGALPAAQRDRVWIVDCGPPTTVRAVGLDGTSLTGLIHLPVGTHPVGSWSGGLIAQDNDGISRVDTSGAVHHIAAGQFSGMAGDRLLLTSCRGPAACSVDVLDIPTGALVASRPGSLIEPQALGYFGRSSAAASPDRRRIVVASGYGHDRLPTFTVVDLTDGTLTPVPAAFIALYRDGVAWSRDGRWLFYRGRDAVPLAWRIGDAKPIRLTGAPGGSILAGA